MAETIRGYGSQALPFKADVRVLDEVKSMVAFAKASFGRIDILGFDNYLVALRIARLRGQTQLARFRVGQACRKGKHQP